ncbi:MAG: hypothetical protein ACOCPW_04660 [Marinilabiliaceae bacterium]
MRKIFFLCLWLFFTVDVQAVSPAGEQLNEDAIRHIINTLPRMVPQLREAGITVSQAYYIWPRDAVLDARGEVLLEQYGYDAIRQEALEIFCKAWFCLNYDTLVEKRRKILSTIEEHHLENPYVEENQKRVNMRILNKDMGHNKEELKAQVGEKNLRQVRVYRDKIQEVWDCIEK